MTARPDPAGRWLVTGAGGMLATDLLDVLGEREVTAAPRARLDVTDADAVSAAVAGCSVVVNCAAWTDVDAAEDREGAAFAVNAVGPATLARACAGAGAWLVHVSTDYVFGGDATSPYPEDALPAPRSAYGRTKAAGEWAVRAEAPGAAHVVRTAWLYGAHGACFPRTMLRLEAERATVEVVTDQWGQPTWTREVAEAVVRLVDSGAPAGTYHATAAGETSWHGFTRELFALAGADPGRVRQTTSDAFVRPAPRPAYSVLGHDAWVRAGVPAPRPWAEALREALPGLLREWGRG